MATIKPNGFAEFISKKTRVAQKRTLAKWKKEAAPLMKEEIEDRLDRGESPVANQRNFKAYSESYKKQIKGDLSFFKKGGKTIPFKPTRPTVPQQYNKKTSPVNIKLTGALRESLRVAAIASGLKVWYTDKKAKWINDPKNPSMPRRAILPLTNEKFKTKIKDKLSSLYVKLFKIN